MTVEVVVFVIAGAIVLAGGVGVVAASNPVHSALMLVMTLFGVAVLFIALEANFLAAVQVIVYAGAIVILFLFVIMLLGVDKSIDLRVEPLVGQRVLAGVIGLALVGLLLVVVLAADPLITGASSLTAELSTDTPDVVTLARVLFTDFIFAFEITAALLTIAVVAAVVLSRQARGESALGSPDDERDQEVAS